MRFFSPSPSADPSNGLRLPFRGSSNPVLFIPYTLIPKHLTVSVGSFAPLR